MLSPVEKVAQQQPHPPQPQQQSGEEAAFNNMAPTAAAAPGYPYAMSQAAAAPGAQGMSFIMQVRRRFKFVRSTWRIQIFGQMELDIADNIFILHQWSRKGTQYNLHTAYLIILHAN